VVYPSAGENDVHFAMGPAWDETAARRTALEKAQAEAEADPQDAFAWFNLGTNLIWFEQYDQAAAAYDRARAIGLPQRMLRYQFGPFFADFHSGRLDDLAALVKYALKVTPNAEEALLWQGWERFARGDSQAAANSFRAAMSAHPGYGEAVKALKYIGR
jgi:tetratricopeptide (TPR) repeat protein